MALRYAVATGNWSNTATWDGGTLPAAGDDVYADGKTVTIDTNVTVANLYNLQRVGGIIGGVFNVSASGFTITANIVAAGSISFPSAMSITATGTTTIIGNITGNINTPTNAVGVGLTIQAGTVNVTGNVQGGGLGGSNNNGSYGIWVLNSAVLNLVGNTVGGASSSGTHGIIFSNTSRGVITGNATGGYNSYGISTTSTLSNALVFNGNCISGTQGGIQNNSTGTVVINGTQTAVGTAGVYAINNTSSGIITINGDILGALSSAPSTAYIVNNGLTGIVNINGNVTARSVSPSTSAGIVNNSGTGTMNIVGNVTGGSVANTIAINNSSLGTLNITGNITGGSHATNTPAIISSTLASINNITGDATAGLYPALISPSFTATNIITGNIVNVAGVPAYNAYKLKISPSNAQQFTFQDTSNNNRVMATSNISPNVPIQANVRLGIVYGSTGEFTGTMAVPIPSNVRVGVSTDATTGTGELTAADFLNAILASSNAAAIRLKNVSTVNITGNQLASY